MQYAKANIKISEQKKFMFKYNGKIWNPKNPEKKLKQLGITWDDVEIIEEVKKEVDNSLNEVDYDKIKNWLHIFDISTKLTTVSSSNNEWLSYLKRYTKCKSITEIKNCIVVDNRYIICPYTEEFPDDIITLLTLMAYKEKDGFNYIDITDTLIDYILEEPNITDKKLAFYIQSAPDIISDELKAAREAVANGVKYVPYNEYIKFYKTHSKEQIKTYFNLNEMQYKTAQKKFGLTI